MQPKVVDVKLLYGTSDTGALGRDMSLGGVLTTDKETYMNYDASGPRVGFATFNPNLPRANGPLSASDDGSALHLSVTDSNVNHYFHSAATNTLFFVPFVTDTDTTAKYFLNINLKDLQVTGVSGTTAGESNLNNNSRKFTVATAGSTGGKIAQVIYRENWRYLVGYGFSPDAELHFSIDSKLRERHSFTAVNQLVKFQPEYVELTDAAVKKMLTKANENFALGRNTQKNVLFATKPDGSTWANKAEQFGAKSHELRYYDRLSDVPEGHKIVGVLYETRNGVLTKNSIVNYLAGTFIKTGTPYLALDTQLWGDGDVAPSYKGTNGGQLPKMPKPLEAIYASDAGDYIPTQFNEDGKAIAADRSGNTYGATYLVLGYIGQDLGGSVINPPDGKNAIYEVQKQQRWLATKFNFKLEWQDPSTAPPSTPLVFKYAVRNTTDWPGRNRTNRVNMRGPVWVANKDAEVKWDEETHSFSSDDPSFKQLTDLNQVSLTPGEYSFYQAAYLGDETDLAKEVAAGEYWERYDLLFPEGLVSNNNYNHFNYSRVGNAVAYRVFSSAGTGISSSVDKPVLAPGKTDTMHFSVNSNGKELQNYAFLTVLPFDGDSRGSKLSVPATINDGKITLLQSAKDGTADSVFTVWYTTDEQVRTAGADDELPTAANLDAAHPENSLATNGVTWHKATRQADGSYMVADPSVPVTAIMVTGDFKPDERISLAYSIAPQAKNHGDVYIADASYVSEGLGVDEVRSGRAKTVYANKTLTGMMWEDRNHDGIYQADKETPKAGVALRLIDQTGAGITSDDKGRPYNVVTASDGSYRFDHLPDVANGPLRVTYVLPGYVPSPAPVASATTANTSADSAAPASRSFRMALSTIGAIAAATNDYDCGSLAGPAAGAGFTDLPSYDSMEDTITATEEDSLDLGVVPVRTISMQKQWKGHLGDTIEPQVDGLDVQLKAGAAAADQVDTARLTAAGNWQGEWSNLCTYNGDGEQNEYTVTETAVPGYTGTLSGDMADGFTLTNQIAKQIIEVQVKWEGVQPGEETPAAVVHLLADGHENVTPLTLTAATDNRGQFADQAGANLAGADITYTVTADNVRGYTLSGITGDEESGYVVTYSRNTISIPVVKKWEGVPVGTETPEVTVRLYANGEDSGSELKLNSDNEYSGEFANVPLTTSLGEDIEYTVREGAVAGYIPDVRGNAAEGFTVTNIYVPTPVTPAPGEKAEQPGQLSVTGGDSLLILTSCAGMLIAAAACCFLFGRRRREEA